MNEAAKYERNVRNWTLVVTGLVAFCAVAAGRDAWNVNAQWNELVETRDARIQAHINQLKDDANNTILSNAFNDPSLKIQMENRKPNLVLTPDYSTIPSETALARQAEHLARTEEENVEIFHHIILAASLTLGAAGSLFFGHKKHQDYKKVLESSGPAPAF